MIRREDWPERLTEHVDLRRAMPFAWGLQDCVLFAADGVLAMTGDDPLGELRGAWHSKASAEALLAGMGGLEAAVTARLGDSTGPLFARRGDVLLVEVGPTLGLALCLGEFAAAAGPRGLEWVERKFWRRAWGVG